MLTLNFTLFSHFKFSLSIWNTMMGTSLLSVPWALSQSGIVMGIIIACGMSIVSAYTALLVLRTHKKESKICCQLMLSKSASWKTQMNFNYRSSWIYSRICSDVRSVDGIFLGIPRVLLLFNRYNWRSSCLLGLDVKLSVQYCHFHLW